MRSFNDKWDIPRVAKELRRRAEGWEFKGDATRGAKHFMRDCRGAHLPTGTMLTFARDVGHFSHGGFRSPVSERCFHLSLAFVDVAKKEALAPMNLIEDWVRAFFTNELRSVWAETPSFKRGGDMVFWHFRVFCDHDWFPIAVEPKEMIKDFRSRGWIRFSEIDFSRGETPKIPIFPVRKWREIFAK